MHIKHTYVSVHNGVPIPCVCWILKYFAWVSSNMDKIGCNIVAIGCISLKLLLHSDSQSPCVFRYFLLVFWLAAIWKFSRVEKMNKMIKIILGKLSVNESDLLIRWDRAHRCASRYDANKNQLTYTWPKNRTEFGVKQMLIRFYRRHVTCSFNVVKPLQCLYFICSWL